MAGLKIDICFWYLDQAVVDEIIETLKEGSFDPEVTHCKDRKSLHALLTNRPPGLVIADYDLPDHLRQIVEEEMEPHYSAIPMIYIVGHNNEMKAAEALQHGVWDYVLKEHIHKLVPSINSSQKYSKVIRQRQEAEHALSESRDRYASIFRAVSDGILLFDPETFAIMDYNPRILELFEVTEEDMKDLRMKDYSCEDEGYTIELAKEYITRVEKDKPFTFEWRNKTATGKRFWTLNSFSMIHINSKSQLLLVTRDITVSRQSELALKESEERLNLALHATSLGLWDWNLVTSEVYYSPVWFSMLGYGPDELAQEFETWTSLLHPDDREKAVKHVQDSIQKRDSSFEIDFRLRHRQGQYIWIKAKGRAVEWDEKGNTTRLTGIHENIQERKKDEIVKQVLFDISNAVIATRNLEELYDKIREYLGRVLDTTNCFLALYNQDSDTLTLPFMKDEKDSFTEFPARKTLTSYVVRTGEAQLIDVQREKELTEQGEIEPVGTPCVSWLGVPLKRDGITIGVFVVQSYTGDVVYTSSDAALLEFASDQIALAIERKRHQDNIRATQERQRRVFESSPDPMLVADTHATILDFNSAFLETFNVKRDAVYGQRIFGFLKRADWKRAMGDFQKTWEKGYLKNLEYGIVRPDGVAFEGEVSCGAIYDSDGKPETMVLIVKNITERKEAEKRLLEAKYKAEESDKLKTAFLSNMSHEIRTPMNAIVGFSDLLTDENLTPEERRDFIAQINQGADDLMRLIDDIIDIAKIEAGQVNVYISECFVGELFRELQLMFLQNIKRTGKDQVELVVKWDWPFEELVIYTDPFRLKQILINLLSNAVKFTDEGEIVLGIEEHPNGVRFYVKDSGIGIREEKQKVIFDRFMQGHDTKTKLYGGTGLGLTISKNLTELLGGEIGVESVSGQGATFWLVLPRNEVPIKHEAALRTPRSDTRSWKGRKMLIAEDDHSNYYFLYEALKATGVEVLWAKNGEETLEIFRKHGDLDLVLMDIQMPVMNGYECTRIIKEERPEVVVIAQTAYAMSGEREISRQAGCDDYLSKPIKVSELLDVIAKHI